MYKTYAQIPIFITVRGNKNDVAKKNCEELKFSYLYIKNLDLFEQTYVISDNKKILDFAKDLGFKKCIYCPCESTKDLKYLEYIATYKYFKEHNYMPDWIIILNIKQLFKNTKLLVDCIRNIDDSYDIIASYTEVTDKSESFIKEYLDEIKDKSKISQITDKREKMPDMSIWAIKTSFAFQCMKYENPANYFIQGKIKYFKNHTIYCDLYDIDDIMKYKIVKELYSQYEEMQKELPIDNPFA